MQRDDDNRDLLELFSRAAKIPRARLDEAAKEHSVTEIIKCPALFKATEAETRRINDILAFMGTYESVRSQEGLGFQISCAEDAYAYLKPSMDGLSYERLDVLLLDTRHRVLKRVCIAEGGLSGCNVFAQKLLRQALLYNASAVMISHNHPSGESRPSQDDISTTRTLGKAFNTIGVDLLDHIVIGKNQFSSFSKLGYSLMEEKSTYRSGSSKKSVDEDRER